MSVWSGCGHPKTPSNTYAPGTRSERCVMCQRQRRHATTRAARVTAGGDLARAFQVVEGARGMVDRLLYLEELEAMARRLGGRVA